MEKNSHMLTVGDFVLNTDSRKLFFKDNTEVALPPTLFTLLKYFVDNQNQVLSKDMIISNVWKGKIVVEANINQNIKKLRDILGDSASNPKYIETVTGEGFRFVANSEDYKSVPIDNISKNPKLIYAAGLTLLLLILLGLFFLFAPQKTEPNIKQMYPLTTLKGQEDYPDLSSDKKFLIFANREKSSWDIFVKPLNKESYHALFTSDEDEMFPRLSNDLTKLIYYVSSKNKCGLFIREIKLDIFWVGEEKAIKICRNPKERLKAEWVNDQEIFISINEDLHSAANIYHFDLVSKQQTLISKPDIKGFGDYALRYSEKLNKLAYIRNIGWSSSELWVYDLETKKHKLIKSTPIQLVDIEWSSDGWILFQPSNREVSKISADGNEESLIAKFLSNVYRLFVINENTLGLVVGDYFVIDIAVLDMKTKKNELLVSSSFNDYLGAKGDDFVAFVSNRSGEPQVWLRDSNDNYTQLSHFKGTFEVKTLSVEHEKGLIIYNKSGVIEIIDTSGKKVFSSENYSNQVHNNPVLDLKNDRFIYSVQYDGEWNIESRSLSSSAERSVLFKGINARPCIETDCIYYFKEKDRHLYKYNPISNTSIQLAEVGDILSVDEWDLYDNENIIFIDAVESNNQMSKLNLVTLNKIKLFDTKVRLFIFNRLNDEIYYNFVSRGNTDIMYSNLQ